MDTQKADEPMLTCPLCGDTDFDCSGLALHYGRCEAAEQLASEYHVKKREWEKEYVKRKFGVAER